MFLHSGYHEGQKTYNGPSSHDGHQAMYTLGRLNPTLFLKIRPKNDACLPSELRHVEHVEHRTSGCY